MMRAAVETTTCREFNESPDIHPSYLLRGLASPSPVLEGLTPSYKLYMNHQRSLLGEMRCCGGVNRYSERGGGAIDPAGEMMATWCWCAVLLVGQAGPSQDQGATTPIVRDVHAIRREVSALLRRDNASAADSARAAAVRRMTEIYREVVGDARFITSPTLQQQKSKLWTRLTRVRDELKRQRAAQRRQPANRGAESLGYAVESQVAAHLEISSQSLGGPWALAAGAAGGGAVADDWGDELIELIQNTIDPSQWNVNGGTAAIAYYRPVHALVVRASSEVHGQVEAALGGLRDAGR
jgi:hypothetical protein